MRRNERTNHPFLPDAAYGPLAKRTNHPDHSHCSSVRLRNAGPMPGDRVRKARKIDPGAFRDALPAYPTDPPFGRGCRASLCLRRLRFVDADIKRTTRRLPRGGPAGCLCASRSVGEMLLLLAFENHYPLFCAFLGDDFGWAVGRVALSTQRQSVAIDDED